MAIPAFLLRETFMFLAFRSLARSIAFLPPVALGLAVLPMPTAGAADTGNPAYADPAMTDADFPFQGEYSGEVPVGGSPLKLGVQVVALGDGAFDVVAYPGGLPGDGWQAPTKLKGKGKRDGAAVAFEIVDPEGKTHKASIKDGAIVSEDGNVKMPKVERKSPTLGTKAPAGATVVFDGKGVEKLEGGKMTPDGLLMQGVTSKESFGDATWHIEFRLPYQPKDRGQGRGNSGAYIQGAYEIQMLDSFGLDGLNNECGGVYSVAAPAVNMCLPPLQWQTYDIDFTAPKYDGEKKVSPARMTVRHNGVVIHENVAVNQITPGGTGGDEKRVKGPLHLQDHGNPVRYRNIWVQPKP
jgi:hypothetical protein